MTVKEYISTKLNSLQIPPSVYNDIVMDSALSLDEEYNSENRVLVNTSMVSLLEEMILMPKMSNVNENGFSVSWDYSTLGKYYLWLCRKWGVTPNKDVVAALGTNTIIDRTSSW